MADPSSNDDKLALLLMRWEDAWDLGEEIPAPELCADCPELVEPLEQRIVILKTMAWMKEDMTEEDLPDRRGDPLVGQTLAGRYRLDHLIAEGGFGQVYRGFDRELQRVVAVKVARPETVGSPAQAEEFLEEARRAAKLRHPGIVAVHDVGRDDRRIFIVSDCIEGRSLADVIATDPPKPADAARLAAEIADALQFAHDHGFVHFDIKPSNILIDQHGRPLLTDFGIAAPSDQVRRREVATVGTLPYMAPEQVAGEIQLIDARTDVHALGVVLYELLTGRLPYQARSAVAVREQILLRQPKPPRSINDAVPTAVDVCRRAMAKHPADRFATAEEMAKALRSCLTMTSRKGHLTLWLAGVAGLAVVTLIFLLSNRSALVGTSDAASPEVEGVLLFDGTNRIVTPLERFAPVTLEAWVRPSRYEDRCHYVIGSDIPSKWGIGVGICGVMLSAERLDGVVKSDQIVPVGNWSHVAAVFAEDETRLYFNGRLAKTGPPTEIAGGTRFVVGNAGEDHPREFFLGQIRSVRISSGERYIEDFVPEEQFAGDAPDASSEAVLIYDGSIVEGDRVIDLSGRGNDGRWQRGGQN